MQYHVFSYLVIFSNIGCLHSKVNHLLLSYKRESRASPVEDMQHLVVCVQQQGILDKNLSINGNRRKNIPSLHVQFVYFQNHCACSIYVCILFNVHFHFPKC